MELMVAIAPPAFVIHPERLDATFELVDLDPNRADVDAPQQLVMDILTELKIPHCDLSPALRKANQPYLTFDGHWTLEGTHRCRRCNRKLLGNTMTFIYPLLFLISCSPNSDTVESNTVSTVAPKNTQSTQNVGQRSVQPVFTQGKGEMGKNQIKVKSIPLFPLTIPPGNGMHKVSYQILGGMVNTVGPMSECVLSVIWQLPIVIFGQGSHPPKQLGCWDSNISRNDSDIEIYRHHYFTICR